LGEGGLDDWEGVREVRVLATTGIQRGESISEA